MSFFSDSAFFRSSQGNFLTDYGADLARSMVVGQLTPNVVISDVIMDAFATINRAHFVPACVRESCYKDQDVLLRMGKLLNVGKKRRFLLAPLTLCKMIVASGVDDNFAKKVMVIAGGTGYSAAILGKMGIRCTLVESCPELYEEASNNLKNNTIVNVEYCDFHNIERHFSGSSFDVIIIDGGCIENIPNLGVLLKEDGFIIALLKTDTVTKQENKANSFHQFLCKGTKIDKTKTQTVLFDAWAPANEEFLFPKSFDF